MDAYEQMKAHMGHQLYVEVRTGEGVAAVRCSQCNCDVVVIPQDKPEPSPIPDWDADCFVLVGRRGVELRPPTAMSPSRRLATVMRFLTGHYGDALVMDVLEEVIGTDVWLRMVTAKHGDDSILDDTPHGAIRRLDVFVGILLDHYGDVLVLNTIEQALGTEAFQLAYRAKGGRDGCDRR